MNVSEYILNRIKSVGVEHVFGIPGDFILPFFETISNKKSEVKLVSACNELNAGYAADGYARIKGMGVAVVTYGPGSFSIVNAVAGAFAESVPLMVISGGPATEDYTNQSILHHILPERIDASINIFRQVTAYASVISAPQEAAAEIDKAIGICLTQKKPVFLEVPSNIQLHEIGQDFSDIDLGEGNASSKETSRAIEAITSRVKKGKRTVILPGHEIHRWSLQEKLLELIDTTGLPFASVFVGKAEYMEHHQQCIGAYQAAGSIPEVRDFVENADNVIFLGMVPSDFNLGGFTAKLDENQVITVWNNRVTIDGRTYEDISIVDVLDGLNKNLSKKVEIDEQAPRHIFSHRVDDDYVPVSDAQLTNKRFYDRIANFFRPGDVILADAGCAINSTHIQLPEESTYVASCFWASIGMGFGATLGACFAAEPHQRVIALEGDGSFQMTAQELSTMIQFGKAPIIFVVNNKGYTAERLIHDGPFNDIPAWKYHKLPEAFGGGSGIEVHTEGELEKAIQLAESHTDNAPLLIEIHIDPWDASEAFKLMSEVLRTH